MMSKRVPGVGHFMKMGKSVLESVTDSNLNETIGHYLQKNILKISQMSEKVLNQHFNDDKLYHFQANLWHKIKVMPLSVLRNYVEVQDLPKTVGMGLTQLIQHSIQDYLDNSMMSKRVPGVGHFMKMGKSVLESVTDSNLNETIGHYLQKNILKISQMSEKVLNQHFNDDKLYHFQANLWHKIKVMPLSVLRNYVEVQDLPKTVGMGHEIWDHIRQTPYLKQQVHDGVYAWYARNQERTFDLLLRDLNIDEELIQNQLTDLLSPILQQVIQTGYLRQRARTYLEKFYYSEAVNQILNKQG